jgi:hypothetical protein
MDERYLLQFPGQALLAVWDPIGLTDRLRIETKKKTTMNTIHKVTMIQKPTTNWAKRMLLFGMLWTVTGMSSIAHASLGGDSSSIETDRLIMRAEKAAKQTPSSTGSYTVHEITLPSGTLVRQYASSAGVIFAVTWKGPFIPNLQQILGDHFQTLVAHQTKQSLVGHRSISHHSADLVIESSGHPRSYVGRAYLPTAIPAGIIPQDIQ